MAIKEMTENEIDQISGGLAQPRPNPILSWPRAPYPDPRGPVPPLEEM
jgi:hypothetical protein